VKIALGADHAGLATKKAIGEELKRLGHEVMSFGAEDGTPVDYPDPAREVAERVSRGDAERGVLVCGTGMGVSIAANKVRGIRATVVHDEYTTIMSRAHNDSNVLCLGGRTMDAAKAVSLVGLWLKTRFEGGRHQKRLDKISRMESGTTE
jgi:RpiB/LacA/LacB family sugar-phosphate isomerase